MKQSDLITIILVASVGMLATFFVGNAILGNPDLEKAEFKTVNEISTSLEEPDPELFNREAINPTVEVEIGTCEDTNKNGILDPEERKKCQGEEDETETVESDTETTTEEEVVEDVVVD